ncbi:unnamed protein product [Pedinophyceae sp. YPF-701]|nr:unnamed protein product [Pedinophyceae sp. YPF-701]
MARLLQQLTTKPSDYVDRTFLRNGGTSEEYFKLLSESTTVYVGNLSFFTTEDQIHEVFARAGDIRRIIMGLHRDNLTPCGFCFVLFYTRQDAEAAVRYVNGTMVDGRVIRVDFDWGFQEGRQYGRGKTGGQVRDDVRTDYDADRGGYGRAIDGPASYGYDGRPRCVCAAHPIWQHGSRPPPRALRLPRCLNSRVSVTVGAGGGVTVAGVGDRSRAVRLVTSVATRTIMGRARNVAGTSM